jgi:hypothetical protein
MEYILETEGIEARALTWEQLVFEIGLKLSKLTVIRALGSLDYSKYVACVRGWVSPKLYEFASLMLSRYPDPEDWMRVRFSDEVHFDWGGKNRLWIIRKPGQRYCPDCIQEKNEPAEKNRKRFYY